VLRIKLQIGEKLLGLVTGLPSIFVITEVILCESAKAS
jgi:hypothetical protein